MGVFLKNETSTYTPSPINVAASLYERHTTSPVDFENDPDVIAGGQASQDDLEDRIAGGVGEVADNLAALEGRIEAVETGKADTAHTHTSAQITDSTFHVGRTDRIGVLLRTGDTGQLAVQTDSITGPAHVTNKRYVDDEISSAAAALATRIEAIEQRLTTIETRLDAAGIPPA